MKLKKAIITGASSGLGQEIAIALSEQGYEVGLIARREQKLKETAQKCSNKTYILSCDVTEYEKTIEQIKELIDKMGGCDLFVIAHGIGPLNPLLRWKRSKEVIDTNVSGFTAIAHVAFRYFRKVRKGHLVSISSTASIRGTSASPDYHASKAYISNYMQGLRKLAWNLKMPIYLTDIKPGFIDTPMLKGLDGLLWVCSARKAALQIVNAIKKKKKMVYITKRWNIIAWLLKYTPDFIYHRI
ncbi:MAG: SDR family NAD(P)-dependent oxidoreductase [Candidatus Muirbacterium halophilum]|nr:SDR family NAD(P)-dependent oxidoreductase [Candidatus Muirbacterium halophilum]